MLDLVRKTLEGMEKRWPMYAMTREAFIVQISHLMERLGMNDDTVRSFLVRATRNGTTLMENGVAVLLTEEWAVRTVERARKAIDKFVENQKPSPHKPYSEVEIEDQVRWIVRDFGHDENATVSLERLSRLLATYDELRATIEAEKSPALDRIIEEVKAETAITTRTEEHPTKS